MFTAQEYYELNAEQKRALEFVLQALHGESSGHVLAKADDAALCDDIFELLAPCKGCVPENYVEDVRGGIMRKFYGVYGAAKNLAVEQLQESGRWRGGKGFGSSWNVIFCVIQPSYEDSTFVVVHDRQFVYFADDNKAWFFNFNTLERLADEVLSIARDIETCYTEHHP
jgi:hypothetical protein